VCVGPVTLTRGDNIEYSLVEGITITGPGVSYKADGSDADVAVRGSVALNMDSSQVRPGGAGSTYQNTAQNLLVQNADVGIFMGGDVNGNQVTNVNMYQIGQFAYRLVNNTENSIAGGFVGDGRCGNMTVIKMERTGFNHVSGVQAEPGPGSNYFDLDEHCLWNTILGHDNCDNPSISRDAGFAFLSSGQLVSLITRPLRCFVSTID
jgi:hypothetical protein